MARPHSFWKDPQAKQHSHIQAAARKKLGMFAWLLDACRNVPFLGLDTLFRFDDAVASMSHGREVLQWWADELRLNVDVVGLEHVPDRGPLLLYGNHPTGMGDGVAVFQALQQKPKLDVALVMNAQGFDRSPAIADVAISVKKAKGGSRGSAGNRDSTGNKRQIWRALEKAIADQRALVLFPSGHLSQPKYPWSNELIEQDWKPGVTSIPMKFPQVRTVPFRIKACNRRVYYWLNRLFPFLKDLLLYAEFHSKIGVRYQVTFLPPYSPGSPAEGREYVMGNAQGRLRID